jgi:Uncharacterized protein related to Endonuclease III
MRDLLKIYATLLNAYGNRHWWPADTAFEMMVGAILTQNTTWLNVEKAMHNFGERLSPEFIAAASHEELASIIRPSGYYNQKALKLKALTEWFKKYSYDVEQARQAEGECLRSELLAVKGVGRETADSILLYALNKPFFVVDAYTRRFFSRLGYSVPKSYDELRENIESSIPQAVPLYNEFHALIVEHAKRHCQKTPSCSSCPVETVCSKWINQ